MYLLLALCFWLFLGFLAYNHLAKSETTKKEQPLLTSDTKALHCYLQAAEQGHAGAMTNIGVLYENGQGVSQDMQQAKFW